MSIFFVKAYKNKQKKMSFDIFLLRLFLWELTDWLLRR